MFTRLRRPWTLIRAGGHLEFWIKSPTSNVGSSLTRFCSYARSKSSCPVTRNPICRDGSTGRMRGTCDYRTNTPRNYTATTKLRVKSPASVFDCLRRKGR